MLGFNSLGASLDTFIFWSSVGFFLWGLIEQFFIFIFMLGWWVFVLLFFSLPCLLAFSIYSVCALLLISKNTFIISC